MRNTQHLVTARFVWLGINADVRQWTRTCLQCQKSKVQRHTIASFKIPDTWFDNIHTDIVGSLPPSKGYSYLLTCVDCFTCWPEVFLLTNIIAESVSQIFGNG